MQFNFSYKTAKEKQSLMLLQGAHMNQPPTGIFPRCHRIMLFVLPNGKTQEMPCKIVLNYSDLKMWVLILDLIAKQLDMPARIQ